MFDLKLVGEPSYAELREFRKRVFASELRIQDEDYQDVFNDHFSKNVLLRDASGVALGAVRLAYSREKQRFYISYLTLLPEARSGSYVRLLLGAVFYLARENGIRVLHGDATDDNLPMYLTAGCRQIGEKYRKHGFSAEWTPIEYVMGTQRREEDVLIARVRPYLAGRDCAWRFSAKLVPCAGEDHYRAVLSRMMVGRQILGCIPHLGNAFDMTTEVVTLVTEADPVALDPEHRADDHDLETSFEAFNRGCNARNIIVVTHETQYLNIARVYSLLTGKRLVMWSEWSPGPELESVLVVLRRSDLGLFRRAMDERSRGWTLGFACADSAPALSELLIRNYLEFLGPASRGTPGVYSLDRMREHDEGPGAASPGAAGGASHVVLSDAPRNTLAELRTRLSSLLRAGLPIGAAMQTIEAGVERSRLHCLIGDPCLSFFPRTSSAVSQPVLELQASS